MTQATEAKGMLRTFWEGFKEGWNSNSAREETTPPTPEDVIEAADEWNVDDMPATAMTTAEAPQGKRSLVAFFEGFCEGLKDGITLQPMETVTIKRFTMTMIMG